LSVAERVGEAVGRTVDKPHALADTLMQKSHTAPPHLGDYVHLLA